MRVFAWLAGVLLMLGGLMSCKTVTIDEARKALHEGMDKQAVVAFFRQHGFPYVFISRKKVDMYQVPHWQWKSHDAVGLLSGDIFHVRTRWVKLRPLEEGISVDVEIDSRNKVTQVVVKPFYIDKMKIDEVRKALREGMDKQAVVAFFMQHGIPYGFGSREEVDMGVPQWQWKSPDAVGVVGGHIPNVRRRWLSPVSEGISIRVEIDSMNKVTQVVVEPTYTGL